MPPVAPGADASPLPRLHDGFDHFCHPAIPDSTQPHASIYVGSASLRNPRRRMPLSLGRWSPRMHRTTHCLSITQIVGTDNVSTARPWPP
jgi:hypothetical protein